MKLCDAMDWELEFGHVADLRIESVLNCIQCASSSQGSSVEEVGRYWSHFSKCHGEYLASMHPGLLGPVLSRTHSETWGSMGSNSVVPQGYDRWGMGVELEERIKGELTLWTLATSLYLNAYVHTLQSILPSCTTPHPIGPLLDTLSSAMAVTALRIRYTSSSVSSTTPHAVETPLVTMLTHAIDGVSHIASNLSIDQMLPGGTLRDSGGGVVSLEESIHRQLQQQGAQELVHQMTRNTCLCSVLANLPDSLLGSPGGARGRLSIDPRCLQWTNTELRTVGTGVGLVQGVLGQVLESCGRYGEQGLHREEMDVKGSVLTVCERWTHYVPLPLNFVEQIVPVTLHFLSNSPYLFNTVKELSPLY